MAKEIERKFLVDESKWEKTTGGFYCRQGYLMISENLIVRIRIYNSEAYLTVKGKDTDIQRNEYEYRIPLEDAEEILNQYCVKPVIEKTRYIEIISGKKWEIDVFHGENEGLIIAEIELSSPDEKFEAPEWLGKEVTGILKYNNASLVRNPFKKW